MSMLLNHDRQELIFVIPNSEAPLEAQHKGIANRTVGSFYMSDRYFDCFEFLNEFDGEFYIDICLCLNNAKKSILALKQNHLEGSFKQNLILQESSIDALEWYVKQESNNFYKIAAPTVNEQKKYLKLDNLDEVYKLIKTFILGDLSKLVFKKIGFNGYVLYVDQSDDFDEKIANGTVRSWNK